MFEAKEDDARRPLRQEMDRLDALDTLMAASNAAVAEQVNETLTEAGYHRHDRGAWRKRRAAQAAKDTGGSRMTKVEVVDQVKTGQAIRSAEVPDDYEARAVITKGYIAGNKKLEAQALACVRKYPGEMIMNYGKSLSPLLDVIADDNPLLKEILLQEVDEQRKGLLGTTSSPLEKLMVEQVVICGMQLSHYERTYYNNLKKGMSLPLSASLQKRIDGAHRRYLASIKTLAQVRRLQLPTVNVALPGSAQVNIGEKQVNLAPAGDQANVSAGAPNAG